MNAIAEILRLLRATDDSGMHTLVLNRPARRNSLDLALIQELRAALDQIANDKAVRAVVLAGNGLAFCAGHDLGEITAHRADADGGEKFFRAVMGECAAMMQQVATLPQPVVAAVHGIATAAGCQLVATCDLAVAAEDARFCTPGVAIGLFCSTPAVALSRAVAAKPAMEMLLTGDLISAEEAHRIFLVNRVVPPGQARAEATGLAQRIAQRSALTVRVGKAAFRRQLGCDLAAAYDDAARVMVENLLAEDAAEGISAFLEKRTPVWQDR